MFEDLAGWLRESKDVVVPLGVVFAAAAFLFNVITEARRWRARLSATYHGSNIFVGGAQPYIVLPIVDSGPQAPAYNRTRHVVLLRNESHRATAILDVVPLSDRGEPLNEVKYRHRAGLPLVIPPWGLVKAFVYLDNEDEKAVAWLRLRDMHGAHMDLRVNVSSIPARWIKPTSDHEADALWSKDTTA